MNQNKLLSMRHQSIF